ncbi:NADP-dependent phosphogluconate dehydrogenase [Aliihoeflea sp. PC F10.4]
MAKAQIGLLGLGTMGSNLALNIAEKGHAVAVYNRTAEKTGAFFENAGDLRERIVPCTTLTEFVQQIRPPRPVILMVQAGKAVDEQIAALREHLSAGDMIIDAGNANFRDTIRRFGELEGSGLTFVGMGVSGGEDGARHGPSIMVGGAQEAWNQIQPILEDIAARYRGEPCAAWLGPGGAGHFVKTIHNGIEYADMQMIAEIYGILRDGAGMTPAEIADIFARWNSGPLESYLVEITASVLRTQDAASGKALVDVIADQAGQKGTGRWAAVEAQLMGVPATTIETAVAARSLSAEKDLRLSAEKTYGAPAAPSIKVDAAFIADLEQALLGAKVAAYAQGFAVMEEASSEFRWNVPLGTVARIWRAGCIIRSQFLSEIASAYETSADPAHLLLLPAFVETMSQASPALRRVVARAVEAGLPVPALGAAVTYFDAFRQGRGTANLIQGQRDFFGAHGFERIDGSGEHHGDWLRS